MEKNVFCPIYKKEVPFKFTGDNPNGMSCSKSGKPYCDNDLCRTATEIRNMSDLNVALNSLDGLQKSGYLPEVMINDLRIMLR